MTLLSFINLLFVELWGRLILYRLRRLQRDWTPISSPYIAAYISREESIKPIADELPPGGIAIVSFDRDNHWFISRLKHQNFHILKVKKLGPFTVVKAHKLSCEQQHIIQKLRQRRLQAIP